MILLMAALALGLALLAVGSAADGRRVRIGLGVSIPLLFLAGPALQALPLPLAIRGLIDPNGNVLLRDGGHTLAAAWPLSLDPVPTREAVGRAAAALAAFAIAFHLASSKTRRQYIPRLIAVTGIAAVTIGLSHRIFGSFAVYGMFAANVRSLLTGPFVNANHTAELLELAAFACLACAFHRNNVLNRYGWLTGMAFCAAGALATLSRGSILAVITGITVFVVLRARSNADGERPRRAATLISTAVAVVLIGGSAAFLGAGALIDRIRSSPVTHDLRFLVWRDSLQVLAAHPAGIGRGAFERVYPAYRTAKSGLPLTFAFVENEPLQILLDLGWPFLVVITVVIALVGRQVWRRGRRDDAEAAYLAGLLAVAAHNVVDFGLETLGVLLPFVAILGTVTGRLGTAEESDPSKKRSWTLVGVACAGLLLGIVSLAHPNAADFDGQMRQARNTAELKAVLVRAQAVHPTDYFYALAFARTEPLKGAAGGPSPRLHALNRALRLCPGCELVHIEVARNLWQMGLRGQAIGEWRLAAELQPQLFSEILKELLAKGATSLQLAAVASADAAKMVEVADFLANEGKAGEAIAVLDQAEALGAAGADMMLTRARLQLASKDLPSAQRTLAQLHAVGSRDPRLAVLDAQIIITLKGSAGADEALSLLDLAATRDPLDLPVQRMRIAIVSDYRKWQAADRAIDGLKLALYQSTGSGVDANIAAARIRTALSQWTAALGEYRIALAQMPKHVDLWIEFAGAAEKAGRDLVARDAYGEASRLRPGDPRITAGQQRLESRRNEIKRAAIEQGASDSGWRKP